MSLRRAIVEADTRELNVTEFCRCHGVSTWFFWTLRRQLARPHPEGGLMLRIEFLPAAHGDCILVPGSGRWSSRKPGIHPVTGRGKRRTVEPCPMRCTPTATPTA